MAIAGMERPIGMQRARPVTDKCFYAERILLARAAGPEPALRCRNQILSLARLSISPLSAPPARNEWPIITPSAEDKPVEFHLQRRAADNICKKNRGFMVLF